MSKGRLEAFSDGVIAIIITIRVLELKMPEGAEWAALRPVLLQAVRRVDGRRRAGRALRHVAHPRPPLRAGAR